MAKFGNLKKQFDPAGRTSVMTLPICWTKPDGTRVYPRLHMVYAGETNKPWTNAVNAFNAKTGLARKAMAGQQGADELALQRDKDLYPKHVIKGWSDVVDDDLTPVPFTEADCREYLEALPQWVFGEIRMYAVQAANFLPPEVPTPDETRDSAGN